MTLRSFIDKKLYRIHGFMHPADAMAFAGILDFQTQNGWRGALAEIGVFYGRSMALMAENARAAGDAVLGIDLFDIGGQKAYVEAMLKREGLADRVTLLPGSSHDVTPDMIVKQSGKVRFFSIDGGHELDNVENDSALALGALTGEGVIAFDDFMNAQYPDVTIGAVRFLEANMDRVRPFAITKSKLYVATAAHADAYLACARTMPLWGTAYREEFAFLGSRVVHIAQPIVRRGMYQELAKRGLGGLADRIPGASARQFAR